MGSYSEAGIYGETKSLISTGSTNPEPTRCEFCTPAAAAFAEEFIALPSIIEIVLLL